METHKVCTQCKQRKPVTAFNKRARARDGLRYTCKVCDGIVRDRWEAEHGTGAGGPRITSIPQSEAGTTLKPKGTPKALSPGSGGPPESPVERGDPAPVTPTPVSERAPEPGGRVIGRIGTQSATGTQIREVVTDPIEETEKALAREYANLLNKKLSVRQRANLMVKIAKSAEGPTAALALAALRDINNATGVTSRQGSALELGPLFVMPEGTSNMKMGSGS